jgi:hypothetical protein
MFGIKIRPDVHLNELERLTISPTALSWRVGKEFPKEFPGAGHKSYWL